MAASLRDKSVQRGRPAQRSRVGRERKYGELQRDGLLPPPRPALSGPPVVDAAHVDAASERWAPLATGASTDPPRGPIDVLLGEATLLGLLYQAHWEPTPPGDGPALPGFSDWQDGPVLHAHSGYELLELVTAIAKAEADLSRAKRGPSGSPMVRAKVVLRELKSALEFLFDDAEYSAEDERLHTLWKTYGRPRSQTQMASALEEYSFFAEDHRAELARLKAFDPALIEEARALAGRLRSRNAELHIAKLSSGAAGFLAHRNQLLALLRDRVARIRRTARYVFAEHPEVLRRFSSDYQRARRRAARERATTPGKASAAS